MKEQHDPLHMMDALLGLKTQLTAAKARAEQAEARAAQLAGALEKYGKHLNKGKGKTCIYWTDATALALTPNARQEPRCDCGFLDALRASATAAADVLRAIRKTWESIWPPESNVELIEAIDKWLATDKDQS